jgi:GNAT superfamily N-acetyltransferase
MTTGRTIRFAETRNIPLKNLLPLYQANDWSSAQKPAQLHKALKASHSVVTAWDARRLVGLANTISDGHLVVYYSHMLVLPEYQRQGIGRRLMAMLMAKYQNFHQHILVADRRAIGFYKKCGFTPAGKTQPMWIYGGRDH